MQIDCFTAYDAMSLIAAIVFTQWSWF